MKTKGWFLARLLCFELSVHEMSCVVVLRKGCLGKLLKY